MKLPLPSHVVLFCFIPPSPLIHHSYTYTNIYTHIHSYTHIHTHFRTHPPTHPFILLPPHRLVRIAAKLIAPVIERDFSSGFDWVIDALKQPGTTSPRGSSTEGHESRTGANSLLHVAMEMDIGKGIAFLKCQDFAKAIEVFKTFEKKEKVLLDQAATNLSFLYFLEGVCDVCDVFA